MTDADEMLDVTWDRVFAIWWATAWRIWLFGALAGAVAGATGAVVAVIVTGAPPATLVNGLIGFVVGIPVSIWVIRVVLLKRYNGFRIALIKE
jgi:hypothetical protein